jgi:site-specific recombinase XerD
MPKLRKVTFEGEIEEFLAKKKSHSTVDAYAASFVKFLEFYQGKYGKDANFGHFLDRVYDDINKPIREQKQVLDNEVSEFVKFLKSKELSNNSIRVYLAGLQNYLKYRHINMSLAFIAVPEATSKKENGKHKWKIEHIKQFIDATPSYRDKAIVACIFQSGLGVTEICNLNYEDVQDELEAGILPICLRLVRQKTKEPFKTFFGRDAVHYLKLYLGTRRQLKPEDPLFVKERERGEARLTPAIIEQTFSEIAKNLPFIKQIEDAYNPARPHSLRAAFNSRLLGKGLEETLREFFMGHAVGKVAKAYMEKPEDELRDTYMTLCEPNLKLEKTSREEINEVTRGKSAISDVLEADVKSLKAKVESLEKMYNLLFDVSPEELRELMQEVSRRKFAQQNEQDNQDKQIVTLPNNDSTKEEMSKLKKKVSMIEQKEEDKKQSA